METMFVSHPAPINHRDASAWQERERTRLEPLGWKMMPTDGEQPPIGYYALPDNSARIDFYREKK